MSEGKIRDAIQALTKPAFADELYWLEASVDSVDISKRLCSVTAISGNSDLVIPDVKLQAAVADGLLLIPVIGSIVFVGYTRLNEPYVHLFSDVDHVLLVVGQSAIEITNDGKIKLNDGSFGGLIKIEDLITGLNKNNELLTAILNVINGAPVNEPGSGSPSALQIALKSAVTGKDLGDFSQIENTNITHGI